ncbi:hypothetical protein K438DRAFT_1753584 [Mycena galopus ATCC 62051]|nr:hypothetical protein K438DRAFT_1753584 [Mycena galopus ATCC 62051]
MKDNLSQKFESGTKSATFGRTPGCTPSAVLKSLLKIISKGCFKESVAHRSNTKEESDHDPISHGGFEAREVTETRAERHALGESQRERAAQRAIAPPPRVSTARRIGHRQRLGDLDAPPDSPTPDHHHHHRECQALVVSDTGGDATRTPTPTPTTTLTTTTNTAKDRTRRGNCSVLSERTARPRGPEEQREPSWSLRGDENPRRVIYTRGGSGTRLEGGWCDKVKLLELEPRMVKIRQKRVPKENGPRAVSGGGSRPRRENMKDLRTESD